MQIFKNSLKLFQWYFQRTHYHENSEAGDCFTELEVTEMLNATGFKNISRIEFETGLSQMIAQKI